MIGRRMKNFKYGWILFLASGSLLALLVLQVSWLNTSIALEKQKFNYQVCKALEEVQIVLQNDRKLYFSLLQWIQSHPDQENQTLNIQSTLDFYPQLKKLIERELKKKEVYLDYSMQILLRSSECMEKEMLVNRKKTNPWYPVQLIFSQEDSPNLSCSQEGNYHLALTFPRKSGFLFYKASMEIAVALLFLGILMFCFASTLWMIQRQKKLSELKNDFINNLTHELKTPIFSIALLTKIFKKQLPTKKNDKTSTYLDLIETQTEHLKKNVERVLQLAWLENKKLQLDCSNTDLHQIILNNVKLFRFLAEQKQGHIHLHLDAKQSIVRGDATHISQVIYNLLDNALKYTEQSPLIKISTRNHPEGLELSIRDNGIGIEEKDQKYIFEKFYRVPTGNVHNVKGFGLGLCYVKLIVEAHKGLIRLKSSLHQGTEFQIFLPHSIS